MKGICIAGGGCDGAITVGRLGGLGNPKYDYHNGISTGALIVFLYATGRYKDLKKNFIADDKDIYNKKAFGKNSNFLRYLADSIFKKRLSIGESLPLRERIFENITDNDLLSAKAKGIIAEVGYFIYSQQDIEWCDIDSSEYRDYVWSSTSVPLVMSNVIDKRGRSLGDGGVVEGVGLERAIIKGCTDIDVFMHYPKSTKFNEKCTRIGLMPDVNKNNHSYQSISEPKTKKDIVKLTAMAIYRDSNDSSLISGLLLAKLKGVNVRVHWLEKELGESSMDFGKEKCLELMQEGHRLAKTDKFTDIYTFEK